MNFTFQGDYPVETGMSTPPKQLIMSSVRSGTSLPKHVLLAMRLSAFILLALGIQVSAATYSQTVSFTGNSKILAGSDPSCGLAGLGEIGGGHRVRLVA